MRHGLTLIELIFSMLIIAVVFSVVPKFMAVSNRAMQLGIKEDALFNAVTQTAMISKLPWDQNTIDTNGAILHAGGLPCNQYRVGGFEGSRNCINSLGFGATMGKEDANYNDIDDYNGDSVTTTGGRLAYTMDTAVAQTGDIKTITVTISANSEKLGGNFASHFFYDSANLGHVQINRRFW